MSSSRKSGATGSSRRTRVEETAAVLRGSDADPPAVRLAGTHANRAYQWSWELAREAGQSSEALGVCCASLHCSSHLSCATRLRSATPVGRRATTRASAISIATSPAGTASSLINSRWSKPRARSPRTRDLRGHRRRADSGMVGVDRDICQRVCALLSPSSTAGARCALGPVLRLRSVAASRRPGRLGGRRAGCRAAQAPA